MFSLQSSSHIFLASMHWNEISQLESETGNCKTYPAPLIGPLGILNMTLQFLSSGARHRVPFVSFKSDLWSTVVIEYHVTLE